MTENYKLDLELNPDEAKELRRILKDHEILSLKISDNSYTFQRYCMATELDVCVTTGTSTLKLSRFKKFKDFPSETKINKDDEMKVYMTMKEAFECGDDDIPFIEGGTNNIERKTKQYIFDTGMHIPVGDSLSDKWQVQKAEIKGSTAEELISKIEPKAEIRDGRGSLYGHKDMIMMFEKGRTDGRLERDLEVAPLIDAVGSLFFTGGTQYTSHEHMKIYEALHKLKPLNQD